MKHYLQVIAFSVFFLICNFVCAQANFIEVVYLKDGKILKGLIIEQIPGQSLKIQSKDGMVYSVQITDVAKITKEGVSESDAIYLSPKKDEFPRFSNSTEIVYSFGIGQVTGGPVKLPNDLSSWEIRTVNGFRLSNGFGCGIGLGLEMFDNFALLPITIDTRFDLSQAKVKPYLTMNLGYAPGLGNAMYNGKFGSLAFGFKTKVDRQISFHALFGYKGLSLTPKNSPEFGPLVHQFLFLSSGITF